MQQKLRAHLEKTAPLTDEEFALVLAQLGEKRLAKGSFLVRQGQPVPAAYFVVAGLLKLVHLDEAGREHVLAFAPEDWWESDFRAYFNQTPATLSLQCVEPTTVYCLPLSGFRALCAHLPKLQNFFLQKALLGSIAGQQRVLSLLTSSAQERYNQFRQQYPQLTPRLSKTLLAAYLGVSRETLSRLA